MVSIKMNDKTKSFENFKSQVFVKENKSGVRSILCAALLGIVSQLITFTSMAGEPSESSYQDLSHLELNQRLYELSIKYIPIHFHGTAGEKQLALSEINRVLKLGADPDYMDGHSISALGESMHRYDVEDLFFVLAPYSQNLGGRHRRYRGLVELAIDKKNHKVVRYLLEYGANPDFVESCDSIMQTYIGSALIQNDYEMVKLLLEFNADPNLVCSQGNSPLLSAILSQQFKIAQLLIQHGASGQGEDLLHQAIKRDAPFWFLEELTQMGFGPMSIDRIGKRTALEFALQKGKLNTYEWLRVR